jgi:transcriptional regulator with XRE-family HTH domain
MNKINEIAKKKNISKKQIVRETGISRSFLYEVINGTGFPTIPIAWKIAKSLDSDISEVFPSNE